MTVKQYFPDGKAQVEYWKLSTETLELCSTQWKLTQKGQKPYLPLQTTPPTFPLKKDQIGTASQDMHLCMHHTWLREMQIIYLCFCHLPNSIALALSEMDKKSRELHVTLRPNKCTTITFDGIKQDGSFIYNTPVKWPHKKRF